MSSLNQLFQHREKDPEVLMCMARGGGSFASNLAQAWLHADPTNCAKLFLLFGDLYDEYERAFRDEIERRNNKAKDL